MSKTQYIVDHLTKDDLHSGVAHVASLGAVIMVFAKLLPVIAATVPIVWYGLLIYESKTVQGWVNARRAKQRRKHLAAARAARLVKAADAREKHHVHPQGSQHPHA
jgi:hypothetical protein